MAYKWLQARGLDRKEPIPLFSVQSTRADMDQWGEDGEGSGSKQLMRRGTHRRFHLEMDRQGEGVGAQQGHCQRLSLT